MLQYSICKKRLFSSGRMELRKALLTVAFAAIAMVSGGMVSAGGMNEGSMDAKGTPPAEIVEVVPSEAGSEGEWRNIW